MSAAAGAAGALIALDDEKKHRAIVAWFEERGALDAAGAVPLPDDHGLSRSLIADMLRHGDLHEVGAGAYWLDRDRAAARRARKKRLMDRSLTAIAAAALTAGVAVLALR